MTPIEFIPKHDQPFTMEQAMRLEIDILVQEIKRLENSIIHLEKTQLELIKFLEDTEEEDGAGEGGSGEDPDGEIEDAIRENEIVISSQKERITMIKIVLMNKVGKESMGHYGIDPIASSPGLASAPAPTPTSDSTDQGGVYL